ncbi:hypothetical protein VSR01_00210 [Actinacidiphila sp. DG2A-62]|uniref:hypothetical protein n=1 Tax=Actinacidiphila sp. DG2A-62 TaxID=3108821 RepID=UPI002DBED7CA|nr:hypothetical protein [Actinacidiphila sp. DG2A-62]MEC3992052.1 hypothetical protein [Actinacidiphila sp. DG2A-62]
MTETNNSARWTSDHLTAPGGTALYAAQQRERLRQMADEVQTLLREYRADLEDVRIDGDKPFERKIRAFLASRPLARLESDLRDAVNSIGRLDREFQRRYVELPAKRQKKAENKALEKATRKGGVNSRVLNTAEQIAGISQGMQDPDKNGKTLTKAGAQQVPAQGAQGAEPSFLDFLQRQG